MSIYSHDIAIVGAACRLPGAPNVEAFWRLLSEGRHAIGQIDSSRWSPHRFWHPRKGESGKTYALAAGLLENIYDFDAAFFGISPREAIQMDPQQRLLLEVVWEAFEDAGIRPSALAGSGTGVYVGASGTDHGNLRQNDPPSGDMHLMTGNTLSIISNRVSYVFDLRGPSFTLDTACSSSLLALHQAAAAIRAGEVDTAVVAGVNLLLSPFPFMGFSAASMLSPTGLCHAFDARADGYVRAEGCVALILQAVERAKDAGNHPRAYLVASGTNADGRTVGLSLPSAESQAQLLREIYEAAEIDPEALAFVEAHGTGTPVGDPAEARSLGLALAQGRSEALPIGSAKTNVGHTEPASGLVGMLKALLALEHDLLPASLHFETPNPNIPFEELKLAVAANALPLPRNGSARLAGINSFGFGGTNVHAVIRDAERAQTVERAKEGGLPPLVISAACEPALRELTSAYKERLQQTADQQEAAELIAAAGLQRDRLDHRLVFWEESREELLKQLHAQTQEDRSRGALGEVHSPERQAVFVFAGNGSQWAGMGRQAMHRNAVFRESLEQSDALFKPLAGWSILEALTAEDLKERLAYAEIAQPLLFALQVALVDALAAQGVTPAGVAGHSVGEVAAAKVAGALTLEQAIKVVYARSYHQRTTHGTGGMAALLLPAEEAAEVLAEPRWQGLDLAAINGPRSVTISGDTDVLKAFAAEARKRRWPLRRLEIEYPFHGPLMEPVRAPLLKDLADLKPTATSIPFISTVTGSEIDGEALTADYWWRNVREPVRFGDAVLKLTEISPLFLEIGPRPVLQGYVNDCLRQAGVKGRALPGFDRNDPEEQDPVRGVVARALAAGAAIDEGRLFGEKPRRKALPHYAWQRKEYRVASSQEAWDLIGQQPDHPLLGYNARPEIPVWTSQLDHELLPFLGDHKVEETVVFPAAGFVEMALAAGKQWLETDDLEVQDLEIFRPLVFDGQRMREVQFRLSSDGLIFEVFSRPREDGANWSQHAKGRLAQLPSKWLDAQQIPAVTGQQSRLLEAEEIYRIARRFGLHYGPAFARVREVEILNDRQAWVRLSPQLPQAELAAAPYLLHPTTLDAVFHGLFALLTRADELPENTTFLPARLGRVRRSAGGGEVVTGLISLRSMTPRSVAVEFRLFDEDGNCVVALDDCRFRAVTLAQDRDQQDLAFRFVGIPLPGISETDSSPAPAPASLRLALEKAELLRQEEQTPEESWLLLDGALRSIASATTAEVIGQEGDGFTLADLIATGRLAADAAPLFERLLRLLEEDGVVQQEAEGRWSLVGSSPYPAARDLLQVLAVDHPERLAEVALTARLMEILPDIFTGKEAIPDAPPYAASLLEQLGEASPASEAALAALVEALQVLLSEWPAERPIRILELGAGSGTLTRRLLRLLPEERFQYLASDPDKRRVERLKLALGPQPGLEVAWLDPQEETAAIEGPFDLVVSLFGLHRSVENLEQLAAIRGKMAGGALLLAVEPEPNAFWDLLFGITTTWWKGDRDERTEGPLKDGGSWQKALELSDFQACESLPLGGPGPEQCLLVARSSVRAVRPSAEGAAAPLILLADQRGPGMELAEALAENLAESGRHVLLAGPQGLDKEKIIYRTGDCLDPEWLAALLLELREESSEAPEILHLAGALAEEEQPSDRVKDRCSVATALLHALKGAACRFWLIAPGAMQHLAGGGLERPSQAALWGFGRVAANEHPEIDFRLLDLHPSLAPEEMAKLLAAEVLNPAGDNELIINDKGRHGLRLRHGLARKTDSRRRKGAGLCLEMRRSGSLDHLHWVPMKRRLPGPNEIEIEVAATGLNFRDVMWAMGLLPEEALEEGFAGPTLGMECSGVITAVGEGVTGMHTGMRVLAFAPACFSSHVVVSTRAVAPIPGDLSFEEAATIPSTFFTAYYALLHLAQIEAGERVLLHGGAGGVGLAALQIAKWRGAEVFATAGSPEKRALLRLLGADHVLDSRSLEFADQILTLTGGEGVDVVLNSLAGEAMERSLQLLRPFGRFLELGKRDFYGGTRLGLRPFRQNISFYGIDADQLLTRRPQLAGRLFREMVELFREGLLRPLPYRRFAYQDVVHAFRLMQQSGHIGKIIVTAPPEEARRLPEAAPALRLSPDATYLVAGGLGGFGLETAAWLVEKGARHLVLLGRSGASSESAQAGVAALRAAGAEVLVEACDLANAEAVEAVITRIQQGMPPLRGLLHTAMVLDDGLLNKLTPERFDRVLRPKVEGAWNLHRATRDMELDFFVLYSSATTTVGNPGQANYVAANAYLESLARQRRAEGLPGLAVAWGAIGDAGYLARHAEVSESLARRLGRQSLSAREALQGLEKILQEGAADIAAASPIYARIDWRAAGSELPILSQSAFREIVAEAGSRGAEAEQQIDLRQMVEGMDLEAATELITGLLAEEVARILRLSDEEVEHDRPLSELGMDSLMALELRMAAEQRLKIEVPLMSLSDGATLGTIGQRLAARLISGSESDSAEEEALALAARHLDEEQLRELRGGDDQVAQVG